MSKNVSQDVAEKDIETLVNAAQLDTNGALRCCISIGSDNINHLFVFQVMQGDKIYMILKFPDELQKELEKYKATLANLQKQ